MDFNRAWAKTMEWEGGGRTHRVPGDPGGTTKWGVSQRAHPEVGVANLTPEEAMAIARADYWNPVRADGLPRELRWDVFDTAFNAGTGTAARILQRSINLCKQAHGYSDFLVEDGVIGPKTLGEASLYPADRLLRVYRAYRAEHYLTLAETGMARFIHGWLRRAEGGEHA